MTWKLRKKKDNQKVVKKDITLSYQAVKCIARLAKRLKLGLIAKYLRRKSDSADCSIDSRLDELKNLTNGDLLILSSNFFHDQSFETAHLDYSTQKLNAIKDIFKRKLINEEYKKWKDSIQSYISKKNSKKNASSGKREESTSAVTKKVSKLQVIRKGVFVDSLSDQSELHDTNQYRRKIITKVSAKPTNIANRDISAGQHAKRLLMMTYMSEESREKFMPATSGGGGAGDGMESSSGISHQSSNSLSYSHEPCITIKGPKQNIEQSSHIHGNVKAISSKTDNVQSGLHPSWVAKQQLKKRRMATGSVDIANAPKGKKIKFDD